MKRAVVIGNGEIGQVLIRKLTKSKFFDLATVIESELPIETFNSEIKELELLNSKVDFIFNTLDNNLTKLISDKLNVINFAPEMSRTLLAPIQLNKAINHSNVSVAPFPIQVCLPFIQVVSNLVNIQYAEIITTLSGNGVSQWTVQNLDELIEVISFMLQDINQNTKGKAIFLINTAQPREKVTFTINLLTKEIGNLEMIKKELLVVNESVRDRLDGYVINVIPTIDNERITISIQLELEENICSDDFIDLDLSVKSALSLLKV